MTIGISLRVEEPSLTAGATTEEGDKHEISCPDRRGHGGGVARNHGYRQPAAPAGTQPYTCTGGDIPSGNYSSITVTRFCDVVPDDVINVVGNLNVADGALFDAQSAPSTIVITIKGNVTATDADTVLLNGITVNGNVTLTGGGGDIPWALKEQHGRRQLHGQRRQAPSGSECGSSNMGGNLTVTNITATDPEDDGKAAVSVVVKTIGKNLNCQNLGPRSTGGAIPGEFNIVGHNTTGQCVGLLSGF